MMRLVRPVTGREELEQIEGVLESGYLTQGGKTAQFEQLVGLRTGVKHAFATSSCTTALHLILEALDIGEGDEVVVSDFTFPATANAVLHTGATPVFADIDLPTMTMDPTALERVMGERTRAVIVVHAFGCTVDMDPILAVAAARDVPVIEDAATALGSTYFERPAGSLGLAAAFSFHPRKTITTGEGGMITTDSEELAERVTVLRSHGGVRGELHTSFVEVGFNYRLSDILSAVGVAQMARLDDVIARRRRIAADLGRALQSVDGVEPPADPPWGGHTYQSFVALLEPGIHRDSVIRNLLSAGIESTLGTYALHLEPAYADLVDGHHLPKSAAARERSLTLPLYVGMTATDVDAIASALAKALRSA